MNSTLAQHSDLLVLQVLREHKGPGVRVKELRERTGLTAPTLIAALKRMRGRRWVTGRRQHSREIEPERARYRSLLLCTITPAGLRACARTEHAFQQACAALIGEPPTP